MKVPQRLRAEAIVILSAQGWTKHQVASVVKVHPKTVQRITVQAKKSAKRIRSSIASMKPLLELDE